MIRNVPQALSSSNSAIPLISFINASLGHAGHVVLPELNLTVLHGERVALLGRSGAGKSTLLEAMRKRLGDQAAWCPQSYALVPMLSAYHNIYMGRLERFSRLQNLANLLRPRRAPWREISALAADLGLEDLLRRPVDQLSGGQQQRVAIARALYQDRPMLLGDEPVSSVDPRQGARLIELIQQRHHTCVVSLHQRELALAHFDRIIGLDAGRVVIDAPSTALTKDDLDALYAAV